LKEPFSQQIIDPYDDRENISKAIEENEDSYTYEINDLEKIDEGVGALEDLRNEKDDDLSYKYEEFMDNIIEKEY